jgi:hypothetical protein
MEGGDTDKKSAEKTQGNGMREGPKERQIDGDTDIEKHVLCHNPNQSTQSEQDGTQYSESTVTPVFSGE